MTRASPGRSRAFAMPGRGVRHATAAAADRTVHRGLRRMLPCHASRAPRPATSAPGCRAWAASRSSGGHSPSIPLCALPTPQTPHMAMAPDDGGRLGHPYAACPGPGWLEPCGTPLRHPGCLCLGHGGFRSRTRCAWRPWRGCGRRALQTGEPQSAASHATADTPGPNTRLLCL